MTTKTSASEDNELPGEMALALAIQGKEWPHTMDARAWATAWMLQLKETPEIYKDEGAMLGWFANAIMAGHDQALAASPCVAMPGASEPVAWLHDVIREDDGDPDQALSFTRDAFPLSEMGIFKSIGARPLCFWPRVAMPEDVMEIIASADRLVAIDDPEVYDLRFTHEEYNTIRAFVRKITGE